MAIEDQSQLSPAHQSCNDCCFALFNGKTQTDCSLGRLDKFRAMGLEVVEAYDNEKEFFVVDGRKCNAFRSKSSTWAKRIPEREQAIALRKEITIKIDFLVYLGDYSSESELFEKLTKTIDALKVQSLSPSSVTVVSNQSTVKVGRLNAWLAVNAADLNWKLNVILERLPDGSRLKQSTAVCLAAEKLGGHFYGFCVAGDEPPAELCQRVDAAINDEVKSFGVLAGPGFLLVARFLFVALDGNNPIPAESVGLEGETLETLTDKLDAVNTQKPGMCLGWTDICGGAACG